MHQGGDGLVELQCVPGEQDYGAVEAPDLDLVLVVHVPHQRRHLVQALGIRCDVPALQHAYAEIIISQRESFEILGQGELGG